MKKLGLLMSALVVVSAPGAAATSSGSVPSFKSREFDTTVKAAMSVAVGDLDRRVAKRNAPRLVDYQRAEAGAVLAKGEMVNLVVQNGKKWR